MLTLVIHTTVMLEIISLAFMGMVVDLWTFRDLDFLRVGLSRPMIGPFATRYFSHLFDPSGFATSVIFVACCQLTVNYSLNTLLVIHHAFSDFY